ncbi:MAG: hypothetical protein KDH17_01740 [Rhodocyclaceae bacterium]|nr:hypothetical protein [Rhodocyclaceae bacterium]
MGPLTRWLLLAVAAFGALAGSYHAYLRQTPHKVLVLIDTSFAMREALPRLPAILRSLEGQRYTVYALETDKAPIHDFSERLRPGRLDAYAPRNLDALKARAGKAPFDQADEVILVSNAGADELNVPARWRVIVP